MEFSRKTYLDRWIERKHNGLVKILTGIHGCGKSYLLRKLFRDHLIKSGVASDHICVHEFPRSLDRSMCSPDVFFADLKKRLPGTGRCYLLLDNVEYLSDTAQVLNSFNHEDRLDVYVTVSHASGFATDVSTVFRGRGDAVHVFPLSFAEFMSGFDGGLHEAWAQYSRYGGMPAVVALESEEEKRSRLTSFLKDACAADMVGQSGVGKTRELEALIRVVASCMGKFIDPTQVAKQSTKRRGCDGQYRWLLSETIGGCVSDHVGASVRHQAKEAVWLAGEVLL